jgi:CelD/BcsL family acetyltransferase involved in cellulose biosynthesis
MATDPAESRGHPAPALGPLVVDEVRSLDAFAALEEEWGAFIEEAPAASFFHTWEWLTARLESYWADEELALLLVRRQGRLVAAAPFVVDRQGEQWCRGSLTLPEDGFDLLCTEHVPEVLDSLFVKLRASRRRWRIGLGRLPADSEVAAALPEAARRNGLSTFVRDADTVRLIHTDGGWDAYLASRSSKVRREWRRKQRKLESAGAVEIRTIRSPKESDEVFDDVVAIESASWKEGEGSSIAGQRAERFYRSLARRCAERSWLRLHLLYLDGRPVAYFYGVAFRNQLYGLKTSYDVAWAKLSPGVVVVLQALQEAFEEGVSTIDFLGFDSRWKVEAANGGRQNLHACVFTASHLDCHACRLARGTVKPFLEKNAPVVLESAGVLAQWFRRGQGPPRRGS